MSKTEKALNAYQTNQTMVRNGNLLTKILKALIAIAFVIARFISVKTARAIGYKMRCIISWALVTLSLTVCVGMQMVMFWSDHYQLSKRIPLVKSPIAYQYAEIVPNNDAFDLVLYIEPKKQSLDKFDLTAQPDELLTVFKTIIPNVSTVNVDNIHEHFYQASLQLRGYSIDNPYRFTSERQSYKENDIKMTTIQMSTMLHQTITSLGLVLQMIICIMLIVLRSVSYMSIKAALGALTAASFLSITPYYLLVFGI